MRLTKDGIGWLIFGILVVWSCTEAAGIMAMLSTIALGGVFILLYVIKQFFHPDGIGWYICGGILVSFCIESGYNSDTVISLILGSICLYVFYMKNKDEIDDMFNGIGMGYMTDPLDDFSYTDSDADPDPDTYSSAETYADLGMAEDNTTVVQVVEETIVTDTIQERAPAEAHLSPEGTDSATTPDTAGTSDTSSDATIEFDIAKE